MFLNLTNTKLNIKPLNNNTITEVKLTRGNNKAMLQLNKVANIKYKHSLSEKIFLFLYSSSIYLFFFYKDTDNL